MSRVDQSGLQGRIRDRPIVPELAAILESAAQAAGIDRVWVFSGGQPGTTGRRTGSTRHDGGRAADVKLIVGGAPLRFANARAPQGVRDFVTACARHGATGIGAATDYMGPESIHVGFGLTPQDHRRLVWGKGGAAANAPAWLRAAAAAGWSGATEPILPAPPPLPRMLGPHEVIARSGLNLRKGPGEGFGIALVLPAGTVVIVRQYHGPARDWALVDINGDGLLDGYLFADYLAPTDADGHDASPAV
jgi:hypothetical protein